MEQPRERLLTMFLGSIQSKYISDTQTLVTRTTPLATNTRVLEINHKFFNECLHKWKIEHQLIQKAFPTLGPQDREFLLSGGFLNFED
jgi:hypothetical protein